MTPARHWKHATPAEIEAIRALAAQRLSWKEIGAATGRTADGARQLAWKRGVIKNRPRFRWSTDALRLLATMKREGKPIREIAGAVGCTVAQAQTRWKRLRRQARALKGRSQ